jgi:ABC-type sulfate transport system substrate-binding protein
LIDWVIWSKELNKPLISYETRALAAALKKAGSNLKIFAKKICLSFEPPYSIVAEEKANGNLGCALLCSSNSIQAHLGG